MEERRFAANIDLEQLFDSGQTFLWEREGEGFVCRHLRGGVRARSVAGGFALSPCGQADVHFWREYFDLDSDYGALLAPVLDAPLAAAMAACPGLRLLRQDFFETLCAFISSAHNAMPRIRSILRGLRSLGREGAFPTPRQVAQAGVEGLRALGLGYRAAYLHASACMVADGLDASAFSALDYEAALRLMLRFPGVGEKVADCVLLFSLGYRQAFPVDVWMLRAMESLYGLSGKPGQVKRQAMERFGPNAGIAQMYLFHAYRKGLLRPETLALGPRARQTPA